MSPEGVRRGSTYVTAEELRVIYDLPSTPKFLKMPIPSFITEAVATSGSDAMIRWIGIEAESLDGGKKKFLWAQNIRKLNLRDSVRRLDLINHILLEKLGEGTEITIDPAVDIEKSDRRTGKVKIITKRGYYGIYVEETKRPGYNFRRLVGNRASLAEVQNTPQYRKTFETVFSLLAKLSSG